VPCQLFFARLPLSFGILGLPQPRHKRARYRKSVGGGFCQHRQQGRLSGKIEPGLNSGPILPD